MSEAARDPRASERQAGLQGGIAALLLTLDPLVASAISLGAVPHWVNRDLLQRLVGKDPHLTEVFQALVDFQFARLDSLGRLHYRDEIREILLARLRADAPQDYLAATHIARAYFDEQAGEAVATERPALQREALYHRLSLDEATSLDLLNERLEEAFYFRQLGEAEMLVAQAEQLRDQLSDEGRTWLLYFVGCLDLAWKRKDQGEAALTQVIKQAASRNLKSLARWKLGQIRVGQQSWSAGIELYKASLRSLAATNRIAYRARVLMSLGQAYCDLADKSGGFVSLPGEEHGGTIRILNVLLQLPFLVLEWMLRQISLVPSLYFRTNYQDWIIAHLMQRAASCFRQAERLFTRTQDPLELTEARLALARVEHQMGGWSRAQHQYALLEKTPVVNQSRYRLAKVRMGQGQADLEEGNFAQAIARLTEAVQVFESFQDTTAAGTANLLLAQAYERQTGSIEAAEAYLKCAEAFRSLNDKLTRTRVIWSLESLVRQFPLPAELGARVNAVLAQPVARQSLMRFPEGIARLYRRLALLLAFPLAYGLTILLGIVGMLWLVLFVEARAVQLNYQAGGDVFLSMLHLIWLMITILLALWSTRGIYSLVGLGAVYILGRELARIEQEQPVHLTYDAEGIERYSDWGGAQAAEPRTVSAAASPHREKLTWNEVTRFISVDFLLLRQPIHLISRTVLKAGSQALMVDGMTAGYGSLQRDIRERLASQPTPVGARNLDFNFLENRSTMAALAFSLATSVLLYMAGQIEISQGGSGATLPITTVVVFTILNLIPVSMIVLLWRLWHHRTRIEAEVGHWKTAIPTWLILVAAVLSSLIGLGWLLLQALLP